MISSIKSRFKINSQGLKDPRVAFKAVSALLAVAVILGLVFSLLLYKKNKALTGENVSLGESLFASQTENEGLRSIVAEQQSIIDSFQGQISGISSVVGNLEKLAKTDAELLKKYSKVYFLNENYVPEKLAPINSQYLLVQNDVDTLVHTDIMAHLTNLLEGARSDGINLLVSSAFRSFDMQAALKSGYKVTYGAGTANQFSADQGYSEHQLGTAVDFATKSSGSASLKFETDPAFKWLKDNAHNYGFVLSYPKGNSYYIFEPWHWRFVGRELATRLHDESKSFYDMDQRTIDEYLIKLFD